MSDSNEPVAIAGVRRQLKEMADGTLRVAIDIEPRDKATFHRLFPEIDVPVALAPLALAGRDTPPLVIDEKPPLTEYGEYAKALRLSGFVTLDEVLTQLGGDAAFLTWLKSQRCAYERKSLKSPCEGYVVPAHVRRIANGAGTGIKPPYSAIPLCNAHHQAQHQHGESALGGKEWFEKKRVEYVTEWAWAQLKAQLGVAHMHEASPVALCRWAIEHGAFGQLPALIRHAGTPLREDI